jgi:hypothetical protein
MKIWVVGKVKIKKWKWELCGVFDTEQAALDICTTKDHFIGPLTLNEKLHEETKPWKGSYYPIKEI